MTGDHRGECGQREFAVGWAVHSLEPEEEARFVAHLPRCAQCAEQVRATENVAALLAMGVVQVDPPERLRKSVLDAAGAAPVQAGAVRLREVSRQPSTPVAAPVSRARRVLVAAAAVGVLAFGAGWLGSSVLQPEPSGQLTASAPPAEQVQEVVLRDVDSAEPVAVVLAGSTSSDVVAVDLAGAPDGQTYWLWGTGQAAPVPLGSITSDGSGTTTVATGDSGSSFTGYAISTEPGGTTPTVPTELVASGTVPA